MKKLLLGSALLASVASSALFAHDGDGCIMFEKSRLAQETTPVNTKLDPSKSEEKFNLIIDRVVSLYSGTIRNMGAELFAEKNWIDKTENAYAMKIDKKWSIHMLGGLYRNKHMTNDATALVTCHEIGHLIGGAPFKNKTVLMSVEGQADFWATAVCLKKYFSEFPEDVVLQDSSIKNKCDTQYPSDIQAQTNCYRTALAGQSLALFFAEGIEGKAPAFGANNPMVRLDTYQNHPEAQCRLDTYLSGSLCQPLDTSDRFEEKLLKDKLTTDFLCDEVNGSKAEKRPACWFNPKVNSVYGDWKKTIKSKSIFGLKNGKIVITFRNHLPGTYRIKLVPNKETSTAEFTTLVKDTYMVDMLTANQTVYADFNYNFIKKVKKQIKFDLLIELDSEIIYRNEVAIDAYSNF